MNTLKRSTSSPMVTLAPFALNFVPQRTHLETTMSATTPLNSRIILKCWFILTILQILTVKSGTRWLNSKARGLAQIVHILQKITPICTNTSNQNMSNPPAILVTFVISFVLPGILWEITMPDFTRHKSCTDMPMEITSHFRRFRSYFLFKL